VGRRKEAGTWHSDRKASGRKNVRIIKEPNGQILPRERVV